MQISARAMRPQLDELDSLESQTDNRPLFRILVTFIPNTTFGSKHFRMLVRKAIQARATQPVFSLNKKPQRHRQFAKSFLVGLNSRESRHQIALAVCSAARVKLAVENRCGKWANRPVAQMTYRLHIVVTIKKITLRSAAAFAVDDRIAVADAI